MALVERIDRCVRLFCVVDQDFRIFPSAEPSHVFGLYPDPAIPLSVAESYP